MFDNFFNDREDILKKREKKNKLHELLDKYGSVEGIEKNAAGADGYEYMFANTGNLIDEVLAERRSGRPLSSAVHESMPQRRNTLLPDDDDFSLEGLELSDRQRKAIKNLDMANQLTIIKALREQQSIENPRYKTERDSSNTKNFENEVYRNNTGADMQEYYAEEFINQTMRPIIKKNEGLYNYPYLDTRSKTTIGIGANIDGAELNEDWYYQDPKTKKLRHLDKNNPGDLALIQGELKKLQDIKDTLPRDKNGRPKNNYRAEYFEKITNLRISGEYLNELYYSRVNGAIEDIKNTIKQYNNDPEKDYSIPDFEKLPQPLQIVLVDMMYNLGKTKFNYKENDKGTGFPKFWDFLARRNVNGMIRESKRGGIPQARNDETAGYLRQLRQLEGWKKPLE